MKLFDSFEAITPTLESSVVAIGVFDGVHIGHQAIIKALHKKGQGKLKGLITFDKNPASYFRPLETGQPIMQLAYRLRLLSQYGLDFVLCLPFDHYIADMSYETFLDTAHEKLHFSHLIFGTGASLGKGCLGNEETLPAYGQAKGFEVEFLQKMQVQNQTVSSTYVKQLISDADLKRIKKCLGRRYSLFIPEFDPKLIEKKGKWLTFSHTFEGLTSLPSGTYTLSLISEHNEVAGFAMLTNHDTMAPKRFTLDLFFKEASLTKGPLTLVFIDKAPPKSQTQLDKERHALPSSHFILQTSKNLTLEEHE